MKKDRFGKSKGPLSKLEIEREAQRELERLSRGAGARSAPFTPPSGPSTPLDDVADSVRGRSAPPPRPMGSPVPDLSAGPTSAPQFGGIPGGRGTPPPSVGPNAPFYDDDEEAADEAANVTEIALRDHAARFGSAPEDLVIRQDPFAAEMMRDQAMRQFLDHQQAKEERPRRGPAGDPVTSVLNRLAARKKAEEEALARGDDGSGETVLDRIRARREAIQAEDDPPPPSQLRGGPRGRPDRNRPRMATIDDDEDDAAESPLAVMRARAEARRPRRPSPPPQVYAVPAAADDEFDTDEIVDLGGDDDPSAIDDAPLDLADDIDDDDLDEDEFEDDELEVEADEDEDEEDGLEDDEPGGPPVPDFADVVARLSGGRAAQSADAQRRAPRASGSGRQATSRKSAAAPKPKTKATATKASPRKATPAKARTTSTSRSATTRVPAARTPTSGSTGATRGRTAKTASGPARLTSGGVKSAPTRARPIGPAGKAARPQKAKAAPSKAKIAPTKAKPAPSKAKIAPTRAKPAPAKAKIAPTRAKAAPAPAKAKIAPTRAKATPTRAKANGGGSDVAARKAAVKAKIAAAAKQARSRR